MFSTRRRCTASSSAIKIRAAMAFLGRYNYLSRIGALSLKPINALLKVGSPAFDQSFGLQRTYRLTPNDLALHIRPPQARQEIRSEILSQEFRSQEAGAKQNRQAAGMESGRSLFRHRRAGSHTRPRQDGCRLHCV